MDEILNNENPFGYTSKDEKMPSVKDVKTFIEKKYNNTLATDVQLIVVRTKLNEYGLFGTIWKNTTSNLEFLGFTLEPTKNIPEKGYIPHGDYSFKRWMSTKLGKTLRLYSVPNFTNVLVHVGNYKKDTQGCILAGKGIDNENSPKMITSSRVLTNFLYDNYEEGVIRIEWM